MFKTVLFSGKSTNMYNKNNLMNIIYTEMYKMF